MTEERGQGKESCAKDEEEKLVRLEVEEEC